VPTENIILLDVPTSEDINRKDYNAKIVAPVREALKEKKGQAKVLLSIYGIPLRVGSVELSDDEKTEVKKLDLEIQERQVVLKHLQAEAFVEAILTRIWPDTTSDAAHWRSKESAGTKAS